MMAMHPSEPGCVPTGCAHRQTGGDGLCRGTGKNRSERESARCGARPLPVSIDIIAIKIFSSHRRQVPRV
jgi:hypothetical protein